MRLIYQAATWKTTVKMVWPNSDKNTKREKSDPAGRRFDSFGYAAVWPTEVEMTHQPTVSGEKDKHHSKWKEQQKRKGTAREEIRT